MTRKEMLETIAAQSGLSLRKVRKLVFRRAAEVRQHFKNVLFYEALTNPETDWKDRDTLEGPIKYRTTNVFEVCNFPSGYVVLFYVATKPGYCNDFIGTRLTLRSFKARR